MAMADLLCMADMAMDKDAIPRHVGLLGRTTET